MTEHDWLTSDNPAAIMWFLRHVQAGVGGRRREKPLITDQQSRLWVEACRAEFDRTRGKVMAGVPWDENITENHVATWTSGSGSIIGSIRAVLLREVVGNPFRPVRVAKVRCPKECRAVHGRTGTWISGPDSHWERCNACKGLLYLPQPEWYTPKIRNMAQAIDERGTFEAWEMGALADGLEEAGCGEEELLRHLRGEERCPTCTGEGGYMIHYFRSCGDCQNPVVPFKPVTSSGWIPLRQPHVRGCWAIELLRGESDG